MSQPKPDRKRWRNTLEELGLEAEPENQPESAPVEPSYPEPRHVEESPEPKEEVVMERRPLPDIEEESIADLVEERMEVESILEEEERIEAEPVLDEGTEETPPAEGSAEKGDKPRRRRRRRRRGKGERTDAPASEAAGGAEAEGPEEDAGPRKSRDEESDEEDESAAVEEVEEPVEVTAHREDDDDDDVELEDMSQWNVPSWQEIIGSLYRPER